MTERARASLLREGATSFALAAFVTIAVLHKGLPALRHDWRIPAAPGSIGPWIASFFEGWRPEGIGSIQAYPTFYLVGFLVWPWERSVDTFAVTLAIVGGSVLLAAFGAMRLARHLGATPAGCVGIGFFACLNPWVYSKFVAGHVLMIFCYAVLLMLAAELARPAPRQWAAVVLAAFAVTQIEFFLVALPLVLLWARRRGAWPVALAAACAFAPIAFGIVASYGDVRATPFNLTWQRSQSVALGAGAILQGYSFDYARAFAPLRPVSFGLAVAALAGLARIAGDRRCVAIVAAAGAAWLFASGTKGPLAVPYTWAVLHVPEIGVFRELYDLMGLVAIGYVVLLARGAGAWTPSAVALLLAAGTFVWPWIAVPPARFFVAASALPRLRMPPDPLARVALEPAFQPLSFEGRGSGVDPDGYARTGFATPVNEVFPTYPLDGALGFATFRHDERYLDALAVVAVETRPYLQTDFPTLRGQWIGGAASSPPSGVRLTSPPLSLLTLSTGTPQLATIGNRPDEDAIFFADALPGVRLGRFVPDGVSNDATSAWTDARLAFALHPEWANAFGGVVTQGTALEPLALPAPGTSLLAETDGRLADDRGRTVATRAGALHWWPLAADARGLRCTGTCVVVLQAALPPGLPEHVPLARARALDATFLAPWLGWARLPAGSSGQTLRLNVRYARAWQAYVWGRPLGHERLDTALNAWNTPAGPNEVPATVVFIETVAAAQLVLEMLAAAAIASLAVIAATR